MLNAAKRGIHSFNLARMLRIAQHDENDCIKAAFHSRDMFYLTIKVLKDFGCSVAVK
jgi:hypothetical protein